LKWFMKIWSFYFLFIFYFLFLFVCRYLPEE
jgi:hypothetical protein